MADDRVQRSLAASSPFAWLLIINPVPREQLEVSKLQEVATEALAWRRQKTFPGKGLGVLVVKFTLAAQRRS